MENNYTVYTQTNNDNDLYDFMDAAADADVTTKESKQILTIYTFVFACLSFSV
jgi:hypothetical protein